jgi:hypothetical protein
MAPPDALYAWAQIAHTIGFSVLVGTVVLFDLRVLGLSKAIPVRALSRLTLPIAFAAVVVILPTGLTMYSAHGAELLGNRIFQLKMALLLGAGLNAAFFRTGPYQSVAAWDTAVAAPIAARASVALSLALWLGVLACGRALGQAVSRL